MSTSVGVFGATGYGGREVVRLIAGHPEAEVAFTTGSSGGHLPHEKGLHETADVYFLALPHGVAAKYASALHERYPASVIIDISGDLRLPTAEAYKEWYGLDHPAPELLGRVPYGLTEVYRDAIVGAKLISNPGCYATSVLVPLLPLLERKLVDPTDIVVDSKSGATGAGRSLREDLLFCELAENFSAYAPGHSHRHIGEMEPLASAKAGQPVAITFCPHLLAVRRGILSALYLRTTESASALSAALADFYAGSTFVHVDGKPPHFADVVMTNDCRMSVHAGTPGRVVVFSAIDNLVKGAAGQAIQNMNVALGFAESAGLPSGGPRK